MRTENLRERPIVAIFIILFLYIVFLIVPPILQLAFEFIKFSLPYIYLLIYFLLSFAPIIILWHFIVPIGLKLPNGDETLKKYHETIRLTTIQPLGLNILLGLIITFMVLASQLVGALILGTSIDLFVIFRNPDMTKADYGWLIWIYALLPGIWEEIALRGVILSLSLNHYSQKNAIIINGILFGLLHSMNIMVRLIMGQDLMFILVIVACQVFYTFCTGIYLSYARIKTQSLLPCIIYHYLIDVIGYIFIAIVWNNIVYNVVFLIMFNGVIPFILILLLIKLWRSNNEQTNNL